VWYVLPVLDHCHEAAHALVAKLGATRPRRWRAVTLNPVPHIQREPWACGYPICRLSYARNDCWLARRLTRVERHPRRGADGVAAAANYTLMLLATIGLRVAIAWLAAKESETLQPIC